MGFPYWASDKIYGSCSCNWTDFHICDGIFGIFECRNFPYEWYLGVSINFRKYFPIANCKWGRGVVVMERYLWEFCAIILQNNILRDNDEELCGGKYIPQISHHCQICPENVVQLRRNDYFHVPGSGYGQQYPRMEYVVCPPDNSLLHRVSYNR